MALVRMDNVGIVVGDLLARLYAKEFAPRDDASVAMRAALEGTLPLADIARGRRDAVVAIRRDWSLRKGERFRQVAWDRAKTRSVATLAASPYAAAMPIAGAPRTASAWIAVATSSLRHSRPRRQADRRGCRPSRARASGGGTRRDGR